MSEIKHTPAPWLPIVAPNDEFWSVYKPDEFDVIGKTYIARDICQGHDDGEADAKLIAAAPELLEALQGMFKHFCAEWTEEDIKGEAVNTEFRKVYQKAQEAIKKATE